MPFEKINSIKRIGTLPTVDIEIESEDHIFFGNGIATSNSHGVAYAVMAYWSAYLKLYDTKNFFVHKLRGSSDKINPDLEKKQLILDAKNFNIEVIGPSIKYPHETFTLIDGRIHIGICDVKNVGKAHLDKLNNELKNFDINKITWPQFLFGVLPLINKRTVENLISVGAFGQFNKSRTEMLHDVSCVLGKALTSKEIQFINNHISGDVVTCIETLLSAGTKKEGGAIATQARISKLNTVLTKLKNPGRSLQDDPSIYAQAEERLLGCAINHSKLNACSDASFADTKCTEISQGKLARSTLAVIVKRIKVHKTTKGDEMAFLSIEDESGELENVVVFTELYGQCKDIIFEEATLLISGEVKDATRKSFIVESIFQI